MTKIIRVRTNGIRTFEGPQEFRLQPVEGQVAVWLRASADVCVWATFNDGVRIPLYVGKALDQVYHFESDIVDLHISTAKTVAYAIRVLQVGTAYRDVIDPVPYQAVVPLDTASETMENRILRHVDAALAARGLSTGRHKGVQYTDDDDEFSGGYQYDEEEDIAINDASVKAVAAKFAPERVQPPRNDNQDQPVRDKLEPEPAEPASKG